MSNMAGRTILSLQSPRVWRTYRGGKEIDKWHGLENACDGEYPEEWLFSTVDAVNPDGKNNGGSLNRVKSGEYEGLTLKEIFQREAGLFLGADHVKRFGSNPGILVKIIDTVERLSIQVHPDRKAARDFFKSDFGKTEAWYIIGGREIGNDKPHIYLGFREGVTKDKWQKLFKNQDIQGMLECLHKIYVKPGEVYYIEGGVPHAIGPGCFLLEIQEPTDYTIRVERTSPQGKPLEDVLCHQGIGFDNIFQCFHYEGLPLKDTLRRWRVSETILLKGAGTQESILIDKACTSLFGLHRLKTEKACRIPGHATFTAAIVLSGSGVLYHENVRMDIRQGDSLFIPASFKEYFIEVVPASNLEIIYCYPPDYTIKNK